MFSSITFIYLFLPITLLVFYVSPSKIRKYILLISSVIFYSSEKLSFLLMMILFIFISYICGIIVYKYKNNIVFYLSIILMLLPLGYFKYSNFLLTNINELFGFSIELNNIVLPLGISFYTFQMLSYVSDIKIGKITPEKNFVNLACYITFFPQLVAGPIVKYSDIKPQINIIKNTFNKFSDGIFYFLIGLGKKVLIANQLGEICELYNGQSIIFTWFFIVSYTLQIYFDFSGYSDMAIGLGKMFGINLPSNFNYPLCASSIKDFWKRWHITLSTFFKEYIYIPLGGSRKGKFRTIINLAIVWFLTGLWHGADWNFIIWGLFFFVLLIIEKNININNIIKRILTPLLIVISFVIFRNNDYLLVFKNMFSGKLVDEFSLFYIKDYLFLMIIAIIGCTPFVKNTVNSILNKINDKSESIVIIIKQIFIIIMMIITTAYIVDGSYNPFLYFRF